MFMWPTSSTNTIGLVTSVNDAEQGRVMIPTGSSAQETIKVNLIGVCARGML